MVVFRILLASLIILIAVLYVLLEVILLVEGLLGRDKNLSWTPWSTKRLTRKQLYSIFALYIVIVFVVTMFSH
jgi:hypothetical protein